MANSIQESINNAIDTIINKRIDALALDKTVIGIIDSVVDSRYGIYKVQCDGGYFNAKSQSENAIYLTGMPVYVQIPQNDMTQDKLIISRASTLRSETKADMIVSAINNFSVIGSNLLTKAKESISTSGLGICSYHDPAEESSDSSTISHRYKNLFGTNYYYKTIDSDIFDVYTKDATALMIEADFRTSLDEEQKQQNNGVYGIGLDLKFKNSLYSIGETQGEIFDYFAKKISGTATVINQNGNYTSIEDSVYEYASRVYKRITATSGAYYTENVNDLKKEDGYIDLYKSYIKAIIEAFKQQSNDIVENINNSWEDVMESYLTLLDELKVETTKAKMKTAYDNWRTTKTGFSKFNNIAFVLDSNNMTGNPYNYSTWSTQYAIFSVDMETFTGINNILFYKDGFELNKNKCKTNNLNENSLREDIFVKNVKIYALKPISAENGDYRLEITSPSGLVFQGDLNNLDIVSKVSKAYYQDLTEKSSFFWFKKSKNVTSVGHNNYHQYGGIGWARLTSKGNRQKINLTLSENAAYENIYKCVAVLDETILLSQEFYIYNMNAKTIPLKISSNLGVNFNFDSGTPVLTCLINDKEYLTDSTTYKYYWAIVVNGQRTFLDGNIININSNSTNIKDITNMLAHNDLMDGIEFYMGTTKITSSINRATRIRYPIKNIGLQNFATFECYVTQTQNNTTKDVGCAILTVKNQSEIMINNYKIVIENGDQVFQYDEYGNSPRSKKLKSPQEIQPLICHLFDPTGYEVQNGSYTLNWIIPKENTMLVFSTEDKNKLINNPNTQIKNVLNTVTQLKFDINELYNEEYQNNQITCQVIYNGLSITKDTNFFFTKIGENGTNGTDTVARILPIASNSILDKQPLTLYRSGLSSLATKRSATNANGESFDWYESTVTQKANVLTLNDGRTGTTSINIATNSLAAHLYLKNGEISSSSITKTMWNVAGATQTALNNNGKHLDTNSTNTTIVWNENYVTSGRTLSNYIIRAKMTYGGREHYAFYPLCIINYKTLPSISRISIDKQFLLKEIMYNADGRNPIYSHVQGVKINNLPKGAKITWRVHGGTTDYTRYNDTDNKWETTADIRLLKNLDGKRNNATVNVTTDPNVNHIYIIPNDAYNGSHCNNRVEAIIQNSAGTVIAVAIIPIYMHLNTFGLASLNAWDGNSVTIDEDNGYVMAPQMGAGTKDANNRFTGILMGKTETRTGQGKSASEIGLFGYSHGLQSIFLDSKTGNATFGLPDGQWLDTSQNPPVPKTSSTANYNEGRIELIPGGESKIGGWKLGNRSLYYTAAGTSPYAYKGTIGNKYTDDYAIGHEKDIDHNDQGILLSAVPAYVSIKGRKLLAADVDNSPESNIKVNDSLELQLDPRQRSIFSIFVHRGSTRTLVSGIDNKGRFIANRLQNGATTGTGSGSSTTFAVSDVWAFGDTTTASYVGAQFEAGNTVDNTKTFVTLFSPKSSVASDSGTVYITGGEHNKNNYTRPLSLHGNVIRLYAYDNNTSHKTSTSTNTRLILSRSSFYAGNDSEAFIYLPTENTKKTDGTIQYNSGSILAFNHLYLRTHTNSLDSSGNNLGNIYIQTRNAANDTSYSYLTLGRNGAATLQGWTDLNAYAYNGNINLRARKTGTNTSWLTLAKSGETVLVGESNVALYTNGKSSTTDNNNSYLYLGATGNFAVKGYNEAYLTARNGIAQIKAQTAGTTKSWLTLNNDGTSLLSGVANIALYTNGKNTTEDNNNSYLYLSSTGGFTGKGYTAVSLTARNGNIGLYAQAAGTTKSSLVLRKDIDSDATSGLTTIDNFNIYSKNNAVNITVGADSYPKTTLNLNSGSWNGGTTPSGGINIFQIGNATLGGIRYRTHVKPGYADSYATTLKNAKTYVAHSAALTGNNTGNDYMNGGLYFNWGYFPGRMFAANTDTGNPNYVNTSIYAKNRIVSASEIRGNTVTAANGIATTKGDIKSNAPASGTGGVVSLRSHTHPFSKGVTVNVYDSNYTDIDLTNAGAGSNATLNVVVNSWAEASASYSGGNFEGGAIYFKAWDGDSSSWKSGSIYVDSEGSLTLGGSVRNLISLEYSSGFGVSSINAYVSNLDYGVSVPDSETVYVTGTSGSPNA